MKRRWIIALGIAAVAAITLVIQLRHPPEMAIYNGKTLKRWSLQLNARDQKDREEAAAMLKSIGSNAVPGLVRLLQMKDPFFQQRFWAVFPRLPSAVKQVVSKRISPPQAALIRHSAAQAMSILGPDAAGAVPVLAHDFRSGDAHARWDAAGALGSIAGPAMPYLLAGLRDSDPNLRRAAAYALGEAGTNTDAGALLGALGDETQFVRMAAGASLAKLGPDLLPFVTNALTSADRRTRLHAAEALSMIRAPRQIAVPLLIDMLHDPEPACRVQAAATLGTFNFPNRQIADALIAALKDPAIKVRVAAVRAISQARLQSATVVPALTGCLRDNSAEVRQAAAESLAVIGAGARAAVPQLMLLASDPQVAVRNAATEALAKIEGTEAVKASSP